MEEQIRAILKEMIGGESDLGFCDPPSPTIVYANRQYPDCVLYTWDFEGNKHNPISKRAIACIVTEIKVVEKEFRKKLDKKLQVKVQADRAYTIESGLDTQFSKGLIASLDALGGDISKPIVIEAEAGDTETVLFCRVYLGGESVRTPKHEDIDFINSLGRISMALGGIPVPASAQKSSPVAQVPHFDDVKACFKPEPVAKPVVKAAEHVAAEEEDSIEYEYSFEGEQLETIKHKTQAEFTAAIKAMTLESSAGLKDELTNAAVYLDVIYSKLKADFDRQLTGLEKAKTTIGKQMKEQGISGEAVGKALGKLMDRPSALAKDCPLSVLQAYAESIAQPKVLGKTSPD